MLSPNTQTGRPQPVKSYLPSCFLTMRARLGGERTLSQDKTLVTQLRTPSAAVAWVSVPPPRVADRAPHESGDRTCSPGKEKPPGS